MTTEQEFDYIERFYEGRLSEEELQEFERIKSEDEQFAGKVKEYQQVFDGIKHFHQQEFLSKLDDWNNKGKQYNFFQANKVYLRAAAAILIILIPISLWIVTSSSPYQSLYNQYYSPYPDVVSSRSATNTLRDAMEAYNSEDYPSAIMLLEEYTDNNEQEPLAELYLGEAYLANNQYDKASETFLQLKQVDDFSDLAGWRLALIYLWQEKIDFAKEQLLEISNSPAHDYQKQAEEMLQEIN